MRSRTRVDASAAAPRAELVPLETVLSTHELARRPLRLPDYQAENDALGTMARALADAPAEALQRMAEGMMDAFPADSAGVSVLSDDRKGLNWVAIAGAWKPYLGRDVPRDLGPWADVLDRGVPMMFAHPERRYAFLAPLSPAMVEWLMVPFHVEGRAIGTIWIAAHDEPRRADRRGFDTEDLRRLVSMGRLAAAAYQATHLLRELHRTDAALQESREELAQRSTELRRATAAEAPRRAALNLLEDTVLARQAMEQANVGLRESEERLAVELTATRLLQSASAPLIEGGSAEMLYQRLVDAAVAITHADMGSMQVVDEAQSGLRLLAWSGFGPEFAEMFRLSGPQAKTSCSVAWQTGRRVIVPDVETWDVLAGTRELQDCLTVGIRAVQSTPLFSRTGRLVGVISTHWRAPHEPNESDLRLLDILARQAADLLERKTSEEAMARMAAIVASSDDAIIGMDLDGVITSWNRGAERLFGYRANEVVNQATEMLISPERGDEEAGILGRIRRGERVEQFETARRQKDGTPLDVSLSVSPIRDAVGRVIGSAMIARDITRRKQAEESLRESDRRKNEFLAVLAHELRGPLAPVRNGLEIMRVRGGDPGTIAVASAMMGRQLDHITRLIDDLIDASRISRGKLELRMEPTELTSIVKDVVEATLPACHGMNHELTVTLEPAPVHVKADPIRLAQIVSNLVNNSCKFTDRGGRIGVSVDREGESAVLRVRDNGIGIPPQHQARVFDMFRQVDSSLERTRGGLGIGLSLVKSIVEMHGGSIVVRSEGVGRGSEFEVRLPILVGPGPDLPEPAVAPHEVIPRRILIVDDNRDTLDSMTLLLELGGHVLHAAHDGLEAVEAAATFQPEVILLDLGLPKLNGYEAARRIRTLPGGRQMKLVAVSGWGQKEDRVRTHEAGFDAHLVKPVPAETLARLLATIVAPSAE